MSYSISISGHLGEGDDAPEREQAVFDQVKAAIADLDGVSSASFYGQHVGSKDLIEPATDTGDAGGTDANTGSVAEPPSDGGSPSGNESAPA